AVGHWMRVDGTRERATLPPAPGRDYPPAARPCGADGDEGAMPAAARAGTLRGSEDCWSEPVHGTRGNGTGQGRWWHEQGLPGREERARRPGGRRPDPR